MSARAAAIVAACGALHALSRPVAAQHDHHRARSTAAGLDTVRVRADRDAVQLRSGATVVDAGTSVAAGGSIAELLRTVPGVDLDADGRLTMRGNTGVLVLMNGRRIPLSGDALVAFLRQMPASALDRIEAGTAMSAREEANGAAGVVNLVFRDALSRHPGMRSVSASLATDDHYMGSVAASGSMGDRLHWDATYGLSAMRPWTDSETSRWSVVPGDLPLHTHEESRARARHRMHSLFAGAAARPARDVTVALRGAFARMDGEYRNSSAFVYTNAAGNRGTSAIASRLDHVIPSGELSAVATVNRGPLRFASEARTSFVDEDFRGDYHDADARYRYMSTVMDGRQRERLLRNEVGVRFSGVKVDLGQQSQFRTIMAGHVATHFDATVSQAFRYRSDVHAAWLVGQRSTGRFRAEAGLRVEGDRTSIEFENAGARTAVRLFPSVSGEWTDARGAPAYRLAYSRRISRPGTELLNPFSMGEDDMHPIVGNPSLLPEVSDQVEFGMERHGARVTLQLTPFLRWTQDPIRLLKAATTSGGSTTTVRNLIRTRSTGSDGTVRARLSDATIVVLAGTVSHMQTQAATSVSRGMFATARLTVDHRLSANTTAQLYAWRRSAQAIEQGEVLPAFTSALALTRLFASGRARATLRLDDPSQSDRVGFRVAEPTFTQESRRRTARPLVSLFASWAVGGAPREDAPVRREGPARIF